jgi:hypothetical protein
MLLKIKNIAKNRYLYRLPTDTMSAVRRETQILNVIYGFSLVHN